MDGLDLIGTANSVFPSPEILQPPSRNKKKKGLMANSFCHYQTKEKKIIKETVTNTSIFGGLRNYYEMHEGGKLKFSKVLIKFSSFLLVIFFIISLQLTANKISTFFFSY